MESVDLSTGLVWVCTFLLSLLCLRTWVGRRRRPDKFPPSPPGLPFLGNLLSLSPREPHLQLTAWRRRYGDVFSLRMGPQDVVVVNGCAAVREALVMKGAHISDRPALFITDAFDCREEGVTLGKYGKKWKYLRRFGLSALRHFGVGKEKMQPIIRRECRVLVSCFKDQEGRPFEVSRFIQTAVCNVIASIVLGRRFEPDDPNFKEEIERVDRTFQLFLDAQPLNFYPALRHVPGFRGMLKEWEKIYHKSHQWFGKFVADHKETFDPTNIRDLIDMCLLEIEQKSGREMSVTEVTIPHITKELFDAGTETTATTLGWALLYLALNPDWQRKVQDELDAIVGSDEIPAYSRREELPYTEATILESLRIRTTVPLALPHSTSSPTSLQGYDIPAHTQVWVNLWSVHMDPAYWPHPDTFDPGRFLDGSGRVKVPEAFMPFSTGRRICLGEQLAKMELFLFLTSLLQQFTFKLPEGAPEPDLSGVMGATLLPGPYKIQAISRKK
ncbi:PREDICTED: cytochrome P450 2D6-like [Branchiostoma belcheri]|uniref:Cytochrome P450 2D6-like n=1 Tax=Branchiostoma belcheri TaxID=7741 RepID=A0A6P4Z0K9_BRABE|nr:PREDICTED: cytochrome P450 2D6-like [Branchiostoma belcheri]